MTPALADRDSLDIFFFPLRPDILPRFSSQLADRVVSWHLHNTGAAPRAPGARWPSARQSRPQVRPACRRCWAGPCLSWGCICACQWRQAAVLRAADSSGGRRRREKGLLLLHITTSRRSRSASSPASPGSATGPGAFVGLDELLSFCSGTTGPVRGAVGCEDTASLEPGTEALWSPATGSR